MTVVDGPLQSRPLSILVTEQPKGALLNYEDYREVSWLAKSYALGSDHPDVALSLNNLATLYLNQGALYKTHGRYAAKASTASPIFTTPRAVTPRRSRS